MFGGDAGRRRYPLLAAGVVFALILAGCTSVFACGGQDAAPRAHHLDPAERTVVGYVPYWGQERAFAVARENIEIFDQISPMWYALGPRGSIVPADDEHTTIAPEQVRFLQRNGVQVIPTVADLRNGEWVSQEVREVMHDPVLRDRHIRNIVRLAARSGYDGIDVDYASLRAGDRAAYTAFVRDLADALHSEDKLLTVSVPAKKPAPGAESHHEAQDYRAIGAAADQVRVRTYDYHRSASEPGPVAPLDRVSEVIEWTVTRVPREKLVLGATLLGYDWPEDGESETVDHRQAMSRANAHGAPVSRAKPGGSPWFRYTDARGRSHEVWFEDVRSVRAKLRLVHRYDLAGAFFWRLGGEDGRIWPMVAAPRSGYCAAPAG